MYYEEKWINGWLWTRGLPDAPFAKASVETVIARLWERVNDLEGQLTEQREAAAA